MSYHQSFTVIYIFGTLGDDDCLKVRRTTDISEETSCNYCIVSLIAENLTEEVNLWNHKIFSVFVDGSWACPETLVH